MSGITAPDVDFRYGLNCIVTSVRNAKEVNLRFVIERKQYTVTYLERKRRFDDRNLSLLLKGSEAVKASIWNVPYGPPGSNKRSWYVTDIWTPNIAGMEKKRIPEPTISIVCKIAYNLGKEFVVCDLGKYFARDVIVMPRATIHSASSNGKSDADIGDYLLILALVIWEIQDDEQKARLIPLWALWDANVRPQNCTVHLNMVESGPENSSLIIPDQVPCMWGVVQNVFKKSMKVYVPTISSSLSVPLSAIYQYDSSFDILEGDWLQLWLTPKVKAQMYNHISEVENWICSNCCWFGSRAKKSYESYLNLRLKSGYFKHGILSSNDGTSSTKPAKPNSKTQGNSNVDSSACVIGTGKVKTLTDKSGKLTTQTSEYVFHLGIMTVYGVKMSKIKNVKIRDLVDVGSELRYRLNTKSDGLKAVWIGPEFVTFKHLHFMPQLTEWIRKRKLDSTIMKEMMKEISDNYEAINKGKEKEPTSQLSQSKKDASADNESKNSKIRDLSGNSKNTSQTSLVSAEESSPRNEVVSFFMNQCVDSGNVNSSYCPEEISSCPTYTEEEEEELEKLWWSEDSEESEDELRPIMRTNVTPSVIEKESIKESQATNSVTAELPREIGKSSSDVEPEESSIFFKKQLVGGNCHEKGSNSFLYPQSVSSTSVSQLSSETSTINIRTSEDSHEKGLETQILPDKPSSGKNAGSQYTIHFKSTPTLLIMMELTKFLLEKGKANSIPEAGEMSVEFVAQLENAMRKTTESGMAVNATTQTEISGPILSFNFKVEDAETVPTDTNDSSVGLIE